MTRCLLGAHGVLLALCLFGMANAQPTSSQVGGVLSSVEDLMLELNSGSLSSANAFRLFMQRAQLVVTGLMHVSILILPGLGGPSTPEESPSSTATNTASGSKGKRGGASSGQGKGKSSGASVGSSTVGGGAIGKSKRPAADVAPGTTADGSDLDAWQRVNSALEHQAASGMDWSNSCIYELDRESGRVELAPIPGYSLAATAAFHAARGNKEGIVCNNYEERGPHFEDWSALASRGARSMAAAPMFSSDDRLIGVLTLASTEPHAFERSRVVWLLAMALAPFAAGLKFASHALRLEHFVGRIMLPLLKENYMRTTGRKKEKESHHNLNNSTQKGARKEMGVRRAPVPKQPRGSAPAMCASDDTAGTANAARPPPRPSGVTRSTAHARKALTDGFNADSTQFAEHAEVLLPTPPSAAAEGVDPAAPTTRTASSPLAATAAYQGAKEDNPAHANGTKYASIAPESPLLSSGTSNANGGPPSGSPRGSSPPQRAKEPLRNVTHRVAANASDGTKVTPPAESVVHLNGKRQQRRGTAGPLEPAPAAASTATKSSSMTSISTATAPSETPTVKSTGAASINASYGDADLDWGDFLYNLISMCIVYVYFSEAAVGGESRAALGAVSIAAVDIALLALRWLWYEQHVSYGSVLFHTVQVYRLVVLPIANTWMGWMLLSKVGIRPGFVAVSGLAIAFVALLLAGLRSRSLLNAPLQLASVVLAAAATPELCGRALGLETSGLQCIGAISVLQFSTGILLPSIAVHIVDLRVTTAKHYLPHVQVSSKFFNFN